MKIKRLDPYRVLIEKEGKMRVPGLVYATEELFSSIKTDESLKQVVNVAYLPGIVSYSFAMPDIHWGYGFPIGGVAAFDIDSGIISPGGVGYDINCGVRLLSTDLAKDEMKRVIKDFLKAMFHHIPCGVGQGGGIKLSKNEMKKVLRDGALWAVNEGFGTDDDLLKIEDFGRIEGADPEAVSKKAIERGRDQLGTVGSGNHFVEIGVVSEIFDEEAATTFGLFKNCITFLIHSGSRGLGYQVCDDYLDIMVKSSKDFDLPDKQLACAYIKSREGSLYISAMKAAANFAFANRQIITHLIRDVFEDFFEDRDHVKLVYDVCHNIAKVEDHVVSGKVKKVCVHRKGATRAFGPGRKELPKIYRDVGQPVLVPGDMGTSSYVLKATKKALDETFGSTCHGAGRVLSRRKAQNAARGRSIKDELEKSGIFVLAASKRTLKEEIPEAYKDVDSVVECVCGAGLCKKVAKLKPIGAIKG